VTKQSRTTLRSIPQDVGGSDTQLLPPRLTIRHLPADSIRLDPTNPHEHSEKQIQQIANSIRVFGFNVPILIDRKRNVVAGHGRLLACKLLGVVGTSGKRR